MNRICVVSVSCLCRACAHGQCMSTGPGPARWSGPKPTWIYTKALGEPHVPNIIRRQIGTFYVKKHTTVLVGCIKKHDFTSLLHQKHNLLRYSSFEIIRYCTRLETARTESVCPAIKKRGLLIKTLLFSFMRQQAVCSFGMRPPAAFSGSEIIPR